MSFANCVKNTLFEKIAELTVEKDYSRERKLPFSIMIHTIVSMGTEAIKDELLKSFKFDDETASTSAFIQQRQKIKPEAFKYLFDSFNNSFKRTKKYKGYYLLAVDGSKIAYQPYPKDSDYYIQNNIGHKGFNQLMLTCLYDILSRRYVDAVVEPIKQCNENRAFYNFVDNYNSSDQSIFIADRFYEAYNSFAHCIENNQKFVIRVKDIKSSGILRSLALPNTDEFDVDISLIITRKQTNKIKNDRTYKYLPRNCTFDFLDDADFYPITFRVTRFKLESNSYECIITNLDRDEFSVEEIKELYHLRWGIETSFRELKYAIDLLSFHSKKADFVKQEVFARLILYNFCEIITTSVVVTKKDRKYEYQLNFTRAIHIYKHFIRIINESPPNVEALISKELLPIRPGRKDPRKVKSQSPISFIYRF